MTARLSRGNCVGGRTLSKRQSELPPARRQKTEERSVRTSSAPAKLREDVDAGWKDIEAGRVSDFGAATIKRRGRGKLACTGSGNVFADLGLKGAPELKTKVRLAVEINRLIKNHRLTRVGAAECLDVSQPEISALKSYQLGGFSVECLMSFRLALRQGTERHTERSRGCPRPVKRRSRSGPRH